MPSPSFMFADSKSIGIPIIHYLMNYTQLLQARRQHDDDFQEIEFIASKNGVLFQDWDNYIKFPTANDSGGKRKKKLW